MKVNLLMTIVYRGVFYGPGEVEVKDVEIVKALIAANQKHGVAQGLIVEKPEVEAGAETEITAENAYEPLDDAELVRLARKSGIKTKNKERQEIIQELNRLTEE